MVVQTPFTVAQKTYNCHFLLVNFFFATFNAFRGHGNFPRVFQRIIPKTKFIREMALKLGSVREDLKSDSMDVLFEQYLRIQNRSYLLCTVLTNRVCDGRLSLEREGRAAGGGYRSGGRRLEEAAVVRMERGCRIDEAAGGRAGAERGGRALVDPAVLLQVIPTAEPLRADGARERPEPGVDALVPRQFFVASERLAARFLVAFERSLAYRTERHSVSYRCSV